MMVVSLILAAGLRIPSLFEDAACVVFRMIIRLIDLLKLIAIEMILQPHDFGYIKEEYPDTTVTYPLKACQNNRLLVGG